MVKKLLSWPPAAFLLEAARLYGRVGAAQSAAALSYFLILTLFPLLMLFLMYLYMVFYLHRILHFHRFYLHNLSLNYLDTNYLIFL